MRKKGKRLAIVESGLQPGEHSIASPPCLCRQVVTRLICPLNHRTLRALCLDEREPLQDVLLGGKLMGGSTEPGCPDFAPAVCNDERGDSQSLLGDDASCWVA